MIRNESKSYWMTFKHLKMDNYPSALSPLTFKAFLSHIKSCKYTLVCGQAHSWLCAISRPCVAKWVVTGLKACFTKCRAWIWLPEFGQFVSQLSTLNRAVNKHTLDFGLWPSHTTVCRGVKKCKSAGECKAKHKSMGWEEIRSFCIFYFLATKYHW